VLTVETSRVASDAVQGEETSLHGVETARQPENSNDYPRLVARLNDRWRVIVSGDRSPYRQWILQRSASRRGQAEWQGQSYCQTRDALLRSIREKIVKASAFYKGAKAMQVAPEALAIIAALPERIGQPGPGGPQR
jgi:hypothetical protein